MIELRLGSIFDSKCDLLIIPCNSDGGISRWVFDNLRANSIDPPNKTIPLGSLPVVCKAKRPRTK